MVCGRRPHLAAASGKQSVMPSHRVDAPVVLTQDIPELGLFRGTSGVIRGTWFAPAVAYEVEFEPTHCACKLRALLSDYQISAAPRHDTHGPA